MAHPEQAPALVVEELESRSLPSVQFLPVGLAEGRAEPPAVKEGTFHPPAFGPGKPASDNATVWIKTDGQEGVFFPLHSYHDTNGRLPPVAFFRE